MEGNNQISRFDVSLNVSDRLDRKQSHEDIIRHELHRIIDIVCHVLDEIVQYPGILSIEEIFKMEHIARLYDHDMLNILNQLTWNITEYKIVPHQLYKLSYVGISIENVKRKGEQLEDFKEIYLIISRLRDECLYKKSDSIEFLDHYVRLLKVLEAKRPYCIIFLIPTLSFRSGNVLNDLFNIITCSDDVFAKKIESMNKLTLEIENLTTPVVALALDFMFDMELIYFLASHYRICSHREVSIHLSFGWMISFMIGGILRRLSQLSSPISALKLLDSFFTKKHFIFANSRSLLFHGVIDAFDEKRNTLINWPFDKKLFDYALYEVLNVDFQNIKNKRAETAERFLNFKPNNSFWDKQFENFMKNKNRNYESIFKTSISYMKEFLAHGIERANEYEIELALKQRNSPFGRSGLDLSYSLCLHEITRSMLPDSAVIVIIGFNLLEYLALFKNSGYSMNYIQDLPSCIVDYYDPLKIYIVSNLEVLKHHKRIDTVIITETVEEYVHTDDMLKIIEDNIPPDTPICVGIFCEDLISIKRQAKHPERILGLHLWPFNGEFVANVININRDVKSKPYALKVKAIMQMLNSFCIQTVNYMHNCEPFFVRCLLSILSEVSRQAMIEDMETVYEVVNAICIAGINPNIILVANILGFDLLLKYANLFQSQNEMLHVEWDFDTLHHIIEIDSEHYSILRGLYDTPYPSIVFDIGYRMDPALPNFIERTISMQNPSSTGILLSSFIEPIIWYFVNATIIKEEYLQILNYSITAVCSYAEMEAGPFRVIDEYLHLYESIFTNNIEEFKFLWLWFVSSGKFFSNSPRRLKLQ